MKNNCKTMKQDEYQTRFPLDTRPNRANRVRISVKDSAVDKLLF